MKILFLQISDFHLPLVYLNEKLKPNWSKTILFIRFVNQIKSCIVHYNKINARVISKELLRIKNYKNKKKSEFEIDV